MSIISDFRIHKQNMGVLPPSKAGHKSGRWVGRENGRIQWEGEQGGPDTLEREKKYLSNTGPYPLKNHKATKPAFNVELAKNHLNGVSPKWYLDPVSSKNVVRVGPPLGKRFGSAHGGIGNREPTKSKTMGSFHWMT